MAIEYQAVQRATADGYVPIGDYALIGDCVSAALVSRCGAIDWLCLPMFESEAWLCRLLDTRRGGCFHIRPVGEFDSSRCYLDGTNVLQTDFVCTGGSVRLIDCMPIGTDDVEELGPQREVLRSVEALTGEPEIDIEIELRPGYGLEQACFAPRGATGWHHQRGGELLVIRSELPLRAVDGGRRLRGRVRLTAGRRYFLSLSHTDGDVAVYPLLGEAAEQRLQRTARWWREWSARCTYGGRYRAAVVRSALTLKILDYARSGAVLAAPTTSLPEAIGYGRNWDYRYCWLRDASMTLRAFLDLGYRSEGEAFIGWMLNAALPAWPQLEVMYTVHGLPPPPEVELDHLEGYRGSRPVRIGNAASFQLQLDVYGEVLITAADYVRRGGWLDRSALRLIEGFGAEIRRRWREPDQGIWEVRGDSRQHTYSKLMAWSGLNALLLLAEQTPLRVDVEQLRADMDEIRRAIDRHGFNIERGSYVGIFDGDDADAALLKMPQYGYIGADHPRMAATFRFLRERLERNGLFFRYDAGFDSETGEEGTFGLCSFWAVEYLAEAGRLDEAHRLFEHIVSFANDLGLLAEEIDPHTGEQLGNFPQAFTHVGLIDAALSLERGARRMEHAEQAPAANRRHKG